MLTIEERLLRLERLVAEIAVAAFDPVPVSYDQHRREAEQIGLAQDGQNLLREVSDRERSEAHIQETENDH